MKEQRSSENPPSTIVPHPLGITHHPQSNDTIVSATNLAPANGLACRTWDLGLVPWPKPVNGKVLLDELAAVFSKFLVLPEFIPVALALWTLHTHAFHLRHFAANIGIESRQCRPRRTRLLNVLGALVNRPVVASHLRPGLLLGLIDEGRPTLLIDETDGLISENDDLCDIVNSDCHRSSAFVVRVSNPQNQRAQIFGITPAAETAASLGSSPPVMSPGLTLFPSWCPKAVVAAGRLPEFFADHCILIRTRRKTRKDHCEPLQNLGRYANSLRRKCARFVLDCSQRISEARPEIPQEISGDLRAVWEPLLPLADLAGEPWSGLVRQTAIALSKKERR
jgi:putative DNA primase/helicase